ncbi:hypothetical protein HEQ60_06465 [Haematospirillum sp. H1815]|uniref:hypothetical protein n=1 Tax=Haematospirillum sp. H1815 TaxID=2723108 RepID=UPI00143B6A83|nr:hypothetical protein [Haematospirillum sp. H1815]NKD77402.1 hypothetical protein [Haematospirillum sp. H1815]
MDALTTASTLETMGRLATRRNMMTSFVRQQGNVDKLLVETLDKTSQRSAVLSAPGPGRGLNLDVLV